MKQDLREALPKVRNPPSFTLRKEKTKEVSRRLLWKGPPLGRSFLFLWEGHLKIQFHKASFNSPYQGSSLKLKEGANVH